MTVAKELILKVKALFDAPVVIPAATPVIAAAVPTPFKLQDGTEITIGIDDPTVSMSPDAGDMVTVAGAPAAAGDYTLQDGTIITVDATGTISLVVAPTPVTQPEFTAPPAQTLEERIAAIESKINAPGVMSAIEGVGGLTIDAIKSMYEKFAIGSTDERIANLEIMMKALMDNSFGYQIRQGQEAAAIQAYKDSIMPMQTAMASQKTLLQTAEAKIVKQDGVIAGMFELIEKVIELPTSTPITLPVNKKDQFNRMDKKEQLIDGFAEGLKKLRAEAKTTA